MSYKTIFEDVSQASAKSKYGLVKLGYGQVEPNHLSARRTGQIYAQLPAAASYKLLENGQFAKYDYANGEVNKTGAGEWMLVFNEIKLYRDNQADCEFAMIPGDYIAQLYSPYDGAPLRTPSGIEWGDYYIDANGVRHPGLIPEGTTGAKQYYGVSAVEDPYELFGVSHPDFYDFDKKYEGKKMKEGTRMVPRLFKTNIGDIFTTNLVLQKDTTTAIALGDKLTPNADGILKVTADVTDAEMVWQVVKVYTMPDDQPGVKIMRIK